MSAILKAQTVNRSCPCTRFTPELCMTFGTQLSTLPFCKSPSSKSWLVFFCRATKLGFFFVRTQRRRSKPLSPPPKVCLQQCSCSIYMITRDPWLIPANYCLGGIGGRPPVKDVLRYRSVITAMKSPAGKGRKTHFFAGCRGTCHHVG